MINFCQFGADRIGAIHTGKIASHADARLRIILDPDRAAAERLVYRYGATVSSEAEALADPDIDPVVIASSTDTHADLIGRLAGSCPTAALPSDRILRRAGRHRCAVRGAARTA